VAVVLSDFFCEWTQPLAPELGVPRFAFSSSAVNGTAVLHSLFCRMPRREDEDDDDSLIPFPDIPSAPAYPWRQLSQLYRTLKEGDEVSEGVKRNFLWNFESSTFVSNTFRRLEGRYLGAPLADLGFRRVRAVGPLAPEADASGNSGGETAVSAADLCAWLDGFAEDGSVVYISFGSMAVLHPPHAAALATALERTGVAFLWDRPVCLSSSCATHAGTHTGHIMDHSALLASLALAPSPASQHWPQKPAGCLLPRGRGHAHGAASHPPPAAHPARLASGLVRGAAAECRRHAARARHGGAQGRPRGAARHAGLPLLRLVGRRA
jgi:hypothetical protein